MTSSNSIHKDESLHNSLSQFASHAARLAGLEACGTITPEQAARQIGELYFELSTSAARSASTH